MSNSASQYRGLLWLFTGAGLLCFWPLLEGARGHIPPAMGLLSGGIAMLCFLTGGNEGGTRGRGGSADARAAAVGAPAE